MNERGRWVWGSRWVAVLLAASGMYGCGGEDAGKDAPADDGFRHAHVLASAAPGKGWTPNDYHLAYNLTELQPTPEDRLLHSQTIIIVAYHNPNLQSDFDKFCAKFNLKCGALTIINQAGNVIDEEWAPS